MSREFVLDSYMRRIIVVLREFQDGDLAVEPKFKEGLMFKELHALVSFSDQALRHRLIRLEDRGIVRCLDQGRSKLYSLARPQKGKKETEASKFVQASFEES